MAVLMVRSWRGMVRARLKTTQKYLIALQNWNAKNPAAGLFTSADLITLASAEAILITKLAAKKPR